ncbi:unnamed protein product [Ilex paraguariensis]|uniref:Uncharacterized protein n=1 Tax=Ilex paraguariensis TaxID=185542 RepID=A0ABC8RTG9_9AQUA
MASGASAQVVGGANFMSDASFADGFDVTSDGGRSRTTGDVEAGLVKMRVNPDGALSMGIIRERGGVQGIEAMPTGAKEMWEAPKALEAALSRRKAMPSWLEAATGPRPVGVGQATSVVMMVEM